MTNRLEKGMEGAYRAIIRLLLWFTGAKEDDV